MSINKLKLIKETMGKVVEKASENKRIGKIVAKVSECERIAKIVAKSSEYRGIAKLALGIAVAMCCVGMEYGNIYAVSGGTAGNTHYVKTTSSSPKGVHNIGNPSYSSSGSTYNYIYFGCQSTPIYWRVLNTTSNGYDMNVGTSATEGLFLLQEYYLLTTAKWDGSSPYGQLWSYEAGGYDSYCSAVRGYLNGNAISGYNAGYTTNGIYQTRFTSQERAAIMKTKKTSETLTTYDYGVYSNGMINGGDKIGWRSSDYQAYGSPLEGDYLFLLSAREAVNSSYGFETSNYYSDGTTYKNRVFSRGWWLRSGCSGNFSRVAAVLTDGSGDNGYNSNDSGALRCALNINLSSVICSSASGASSSSSFASLSQNANSGTAGSSESTSNSSKLTIYDSTNRGSFSLAPTAITAAPGTRLTFIYSGAVSGDRITALLYKTSGTTKNPVYYANIKAASAGSGNSVSVTLPSDLDEDSYTLKIMTEQVNGGTYTNYAGYKDVALTVTSSLTSIVTSTTDTTAPNVTNVYKNGNDGTYFKLTVSDSGGLALITNSNGTSLLKDIYSLGTGGTCNVATTSGTTAIRVYDRNGNYKDVNSDITPDATPPAIESVTYSGGNYVITVSDEESGVWKITDESDNTLTGADFSI